MGRRRDADDEATAGAAGGGAPPPTAAGEERLIREFSTLRRELEAVSKGLVRSPDDERRLARKGVITERLRVLSVEMSAVGMKGHHDARSPASDVDAVGSDRASSGTDDEGHCADLPRRPRVARSAACRAYESSDMDDSDGEGGGGGRRGGGRAEQQRRGEDGGADHGEVGTGTGGKGGERWGGVAWRCGGGWGERKVEPRAGGAAWPPGFCRRPCRRARLGCPRGAVRGGRLLTAWRYGLGFLGGRPTRGGRDGGCAGAA